MLIDRRVRDENLLITEAEMRTIRDGVPYYRCSVLNKKKQKDITFPFHIHDSAGIFRC